MLMVMLMLVELLRIGYIALCGAVCRCGRRCYRVSFLVDMVVSGNCIVKVRLRGCRGTGVGVGIVGGVGIVVVVVDIDVKDGRGRG